MKPIIFALMACLIAGTLSAEPVNLKGETVSICDDGSEWPPYTYYKRVNGKKTDELVGYSVDVIREIFDKHGIKFKLKLLPWKRCQREMAEGKKYQMFLSGGLNRERIKTYYITQPYYFTKFYYFWSEKHHPNGLNIRTDSLKNALYDLVNKYKMGNILGYGMGIYKKHNISISKVDFGAMDYKALAQKLRLGRIDVFYESLEILSGCQAIGTADILDDPEFKSAVIPGITPRGYQFMITKNHKYGLALRNLIDQEITLMRATGRLDELLKKYIKKSKPLFN
jgi:polar amino acid transport system substrate-binding protein